MNIGINVKDKNFSWSETGLEKIRTYLINNLGYSYDDISIVSGKVRNAEREKQKSRFLKGNSIIMLGSSAISTGVDLQDNASALFLCDFDWNPTTRRTNFG
jgi:transcription-repair coupling factor (superfamily II helicase)